MIIKKAEIVAVTVKPEQYPPDNMKEIAFVGRSNVGKSSLLNLITNRRKLAKISGSPGKTRTINFYEINEEFRIVDLPGYGYAKVSRAVTEDWGPMMEKYFKTRKGLIKAVQLVDIRHGPTDKDIKMYEYLKYYGLAGLVVATKSDKISKNRIRESEEMIRKGLGMGKTGRVIPVSALKKTGHDVLLEEIERVLGD